MNLSKKKHLAARTLGVGKARILFNTNRLEDIKEAITKQDIRDLHSSGAILIKEIKGRRKVVRRKTRVRAGSRKKNIVRRKQKYVILVRKLRRHLFQLRKNKQISKELFLTLRKEAKTKSLPSLGHLKERIKELK